MSRDLDNVLQSLEQQVKDFSIDISGTNMEDSINNDNVEHQHSTRQMTNTQGTHHSRSGQRYKGRQQDSDDDDDNDIIGHLLQSPTFPSTPSSTSKAMLDQQPSNASLKKIGLARSLSSSTRKFPKKLLPEEPVPCIPLPSSTSPPSNCATNPSAATTAHSDAQNDTDDLHQAMQLAWAVLDAEPSSDSQIKEPSPPPQQDETKADSTRQPTNSNQLHNDATNGTSSTSSGMTNVTPTQTMTTRIFIEDAKTHKTVQLTNVLTTAMVIQYLKRKDLLDNSGDWTLFEIANSHGVERPLRLWEIVMDITGCWEQNTNNALLVKKYGFYETLTMDSIRDRPSPVHGWLHIEYKKGKWQKRYCFIKDHAIYHAKDSKCANSAILCHLAAFDVYTLLQPSTTCPTPFVFALRAQDRAAIFEKEHDYIRLFTAENQSSMETWVLGIRQAKSIIQYQQHPKRVQNPLAALTSATTTLTSGGGDPGLRRYKSTKREPVSLEDTNNNTIEGRSRSMSRSESSSRRITDETIKRKASTRGLSRNGTTRNREHHHQTHQHETNDTNAAITTTTTNEEGTTSSTLIHIEDKLQFSKGSLLDKGNMAPLMTPASSSTAAHSATITTTSTSSAPPSTTNGNTSSQHHHHHHHHHQPMQNITSSGGNSNRNMMSRSKSTRETSSSSHNTQHRSRADDGVLSHHTSIRRKDRGQQHRQQQQHDVPLPNTHAIMTSSSSNPMSTTSRNNTDNTLLKLNNTPERFHTQTLLQRQMKPLLNFDQDHQPSDHRRG